MLYVLGELLASVVWAVYYVLERTVRLVVPSSFQQKSVEGQIVLITGGGSGIGRLLSLRFAKLGATIVTWDINENGNNETVEMVTEEGGKAFGYKVDMSDRESIYAAATKTTAEVGPISILINNAGIVSGTYLLDTPDMKIIKSFEVNALAHFWTIKAFLPSMITNKQGHIANIASIAGLAGTNKLADYCASKFACVGLDESLRVELYNQGHDEYIKTTLVCPYFITTGMFAGVQSKIVPLLSPDFVADTTVNGILCDKEVILMPWWGMFLLVAKNLLPAPAFMKISQAFGFNCSMDQFEGRKKEE